MSEIAAQLELAGMPCADIHKMFPDLGVSEYTPAKQEQLRTLASYHAGLTKYAMRKCRVSIYHVVDLNAGPGRYQTPEGMPVTGSPLILLDVMEQHGLDYRALFIDNHKASCDRLLEYCGNKANVEIRHGDHDAILDEYIGAFRRPCYGLIYCDPNGHKVPVDALVRFLRAYPRMEVLIHTPATAWKRTRHLHGKYLRNEVDRLKTYWLIREPEGAQQWTFLLGSNFKDFNKPYKKQKLYPLDSDKGRQIIEQLNYTRDERESLYQPGLLQLQRVPEAS